MEKALDLNKSIEIDDLAVSPIVSHIQSCFERAKTAKEPIDSRMVRNVYAFKCRYEDEKLAKIRELGGSEIYLPLCNIKARALKAWLTDIFFSTGEPPFDIAPTPIPEPSEGIEENARADLQQQLSQIMQNLIVIQQTTGQDVMSLFLPIIKRSIDNAKSMYLERIEEETSKIAEREKKRIDDQFVEGGFYDALDECLFDLAIFPSAILKSCVPRKIKAFDKNRVVVEKVVPTYNRVSPFDIFPSPNVADFSDWVIEILHLLPQDLRNVKGLEGSVDENIDVILGLYEETGYGISVDNKYKRLQLEDKDKINLTTIDVIEFWGSIKGSMIKESDVPVPDDVKIEEDEYYDVCVWVCDGYILKFVFNPDPLGQKPYHKCSFIEVPDSFWGLSLIDILYDLQVGVNSLARATINNSALSSGPMIERNIDRVPPHEEKVIIPWKIFDSVSVGLTNQPAYMFYQPNLTANALITVIAYFMKNADELSGVPSYAHGDVSLGGSALRTSSGFAMLMNNANRGIKEVVKNIDKGLIEPAVKRTYYFNVVDYYGYGDEIPDLNIKARGSIILMEKMTQTQKMLELLNLTNNPIDMQLIGIEGRKYLLEHIFKNFGVNVPMTADIQQMVGSLQQQLSQMTQQKAPPKKEEPDMITQTAQAQRQEMLPEGGF